MTEPPETITLQRVKQNDFATYGTLDPNYCVLELPWHDNATGVSCVPAGLYTAERYFSPHHQCVVFRLIDVPDREDCEIHIGCLPRDSRGCILIGSRFGDVDYGDGKPDGKGPGVLGSHTAFHSFMLAHPEQRFLLDVRSVHTSP